MADTPRNDTPRVDENRSDPSRGINKTDARSKRQREKSKPASDPVTQLQNEMRELKQWKEKLHGDGVVSINGNKLTIDQSKLGALPGGYGPVDDEVCLNGFAGIRKLIGTRTRLTET